MKTLISKIDYQDVISLGNGEEKKIDDNFVLYKYLEEDIIVVRSIFSGEDCFQILINGNNLIFEQLVEDSFFYNELNLDTPQNEKDFKVANMLLEVSSDIADQMVKQNLPNNNIWDGENYTKEAQELFNNYYEDVYDRVLNYTLKIFK